MFFLFCKGLFILLGSFVIAATFVSLIRKDAWWIRGFDFPRAQFLFLGVLVLVLSPACLEISPFSVIFWLLLLCSLGVQAWRIWPYTRLAGKQVLDSELRQGGTSLRLMVANVLQSNRESDRLRELIAEVDPDILLTLETSQWWQKELLPLEETYPWNIQHPQDNTYGMLLFSRYQITERKIHFLVEQEVPSFEVTVRLPSGDHIRLWCVHPEPPSPTENERSTERDAELVLVGRRVRDLLMPVIVAGDLNDVAWSRTTTLFQRISSLLDPRIGRGRFSTFHAQHRLLRWPLDHIFHSDHFRLIGMRVLPPFGSDHFPILAELSYEPQKNHKQEEPDEDAEARAHAEEKVQKAL